MKYKEAPRNYIRKEDDKNEKRSLYSKFKGNYNFNKPHSDMSKVLNNGVLRLLN